MSECILGKHSAELDEQGMLTLYGPNTRMALPYDEAYKLMNWLYDNRSTLYRLAQQDTEQEQQLEILLHQNELDHLDELKAVIPDLHETKVKVLGAPLGMVPEQAVHLLDDLDIEYTIHPLLLEDHDSFAQG